MPKLIQLIARPSWLGLTLFFLLLPFLAFPEIIFGRQTLHRTDLTWIHYPGHIFMANEWLAGRVPLWDPYQRLGVPFLAEPQIGVLYPLRLLFLSPFSPSLELSLFILLHYTLAALFTYLLARSLPLGQTPALIAGLTFGLGGFLMAQVSNLNIMTGAVWLPLILYGVIQATRRRSWPAALLAGLPLALQILTAHSQIIFYTLVTLMGYGVYRLSADLLTGPTRNIRSALHTALLLAVTTGSGLLLAAPQLLPTFELVQFTVRSQARGLDLLTENSFPAVMWLNLLLPSAFGNNAISFKGGDPFQEVFIYVGLLPLLLAGLSLVTWREQWQRSHYPFFLLLLISAVLLAMGGNTPLYAWVIQYLPGFDIFRIPSRWLMVVNLALAILAGFGAEALLSQNLSRARWLLFVLVGLLLSGGVMLIWLFGPQLLTWSRQLDEVQQRLLNAFLEKGFHINPVYQQRLLLSRAAFLTVPAFHFLFNVTIAVTLLTLWTARRSSARTLAVLLLLAISIDLLTAGGTVINPVKPDSHWQQLAEGTAYVLEHVGAGRVFPLGVSDESGAISYLGQYFPSARGVRSASGYASPLQLARYSTFLDEADPVQALQVLGVRYLLTRGQMGADVAATYPLVYQDEHAYVYENKQALPRAFLVHEAIRVASPTAALAYFQGRSIDPRQTVILEAATATPPLTSPTSTQASSATIVNENPQLIEIETQSTEPGYLVLLDTFYPGWIATVDGQPTPIYQADYLGRAVFVPAGAHQVRFEYRPASFRIGLWLALGMVGVLGLVVGVRLYFVKVLPGPNEPGESRVFLMKG